MITPPDLADLDIPGFHEVLARVKRTPLEIGPDDRIMYGMALHVGPFVGPLVQAILAGAAFCLYDPDARGANIGTSIEAMRPTSLWVPPKKAVPPLLIGDYQGRDLSSLKTALIFGYMPAEDSRQLEDLLPNGSVIHSWSMRESMLVCGCTKDEPVDKRLGTVGRPMFDDLIRIENGELLIAGDFVANHKGKEDKYTDDGWFHTGDAAEWDADEYLIVKGRLEDAKAAPTEMR